MKLLPAPWAALGTVLGVSTLLIPLSGCVGTRTDTNTDTATATAMCPVRVERGDNLAHYRVPINIDDGESVDVPRIGAAQLFAPPGQHTLSMRPVNTMGLGLGALFSPIHTLVDLGATAAFGGLPDFFDTELAFECQGGETHHFLATPSVWSETTLIEVEWDGAEAEAGGGPSAACRGLRRS